MGITCDLVAEKACGSTPPCPLRSAHLGTTTRSHINMFLPARSALRCPARGRQDVCRGQLMILSPSANERSDAQLATGCAVGVVVYPLYAVRGLWRAGGPMAMSSRDHMVARRVRGRPCATKLIGQCDGFRHGVLVHEAHFCRSIVWGPVRAAPHVCSYEET